ncbi:MAG: BON domain-containing protein [Nitrospinaceae bacterium]|nr:BON domain-containing protein [Nitrospinaceae bacterium]
MKNVRALSAVLLTGLLIFMSGCASIVTSAAQKAWENRSTEDQVTDAKIHSGILDRVKNKDKGLLLDVSVDVWEQRVMITGTLDDSNVRSAIENLAREDSRIKSLHNEIQIVTKAEKEARRDQKEKGDEEKSGAGQAVNDFWIETKIKVQLLTDTNVSSVNYFYRSVLNKVYVIGEAGSDAEEQLVLSIIKNTEGVKSVTEYIDVTSTY